MEGRNENLGQRIQQVDSKADDITPGFYLQILEQGAEDFRELAGARNTLWDAIRAVGFLDRYHDETGVDVDLEFANAFAANAGARLEGDCEDDFRAAWERRKEYHEKENELQQRLEAGGSVSQREALELFREKSADAFLYAPVMESVTGRDFSDAVYAHLQLWDIVDEHDDREEDVDYNRPNAFEHVSRDILGERADAVADSVADFEFGEYGFVEEELGDQYESAWSVL